jgi:hypothetical protein
MNDDTEAQIAALNQIGAGATKACEDAGAKIAAFGVAFNAVREAMSKR